MVNELSRIEQFQFNHYLRINAIMLPPIEIISRIIEATPKLNRKHNGAMNYTIKLITSRAARNHLPQILGDIYKNATVIADILQFNKTCDFYSVYKGKKFVGLVAFEKGLPFNSVSFYQTEGFCISLPLAKRFYDFPNTGIEPYYSTVDAKTKDSLESAGLLVDYTPEYQMRYDPKRTKLKGIPKGIEIIRLNEQHLPEISKLFSMVPGMVWTPKSLMYGPYYGAFDGNMLVSVAGAHFNTKYVAEVGNVITLRMYRRRGLARAVTQAVINELNPYSKIIYLSVYVDNTPAVNLYLDMGFEVSGLSYICKYYLTPIFSRKDFPRTLKTPAK